MAVRSARHPLSATNDEGHAHWSVEDSIQIVDATETGNSLSFPDSGQGAWLVVLGAFFGLFVSFGWTNCVGVFQAYYQAHQLQPESPSTVSWISGLSLFMMFITVHLLVECLTISGLDRPLLLAGTALHVIGLVMASLSSQLYQFILSQTICSPIGASMVLYPSFNCVTTWFLKRRALAMGITASGSSLGGVLFPILVDRLIPNIGFAWTMRTCAFVMLALLSVTNFTVRSRLPPHPKNVELSAFLQPLVDLPFLLTALVAFFYSMSMFIPITFLVTYGEHVGMSSKLARYLVSIFNGASAIGRVLPGYAADNVGNFNISLLAACLSTIFVLALRLPGHSNAAVVGFAASFGFSSGTYTAMSPALVAQISDIREIGTRSGTMYAFMSVAGLTGSPIGGALISAAGGSYWKLQLFAGSMLATGSCFYIAARMYLAKGNWRGKI